MCAGLRPLVGLRAAAIPPANMRRDLLLGEVAHRLAQQLVLIVQEHIVVFGKIHNELLGISTIADFLYTMVLSVFVGRFSPCGAKNDTQKMYVQSFYHARRRR